MTGAPRHSSPREGAGMSGGLPIISNDAHGAPGRADGRAGDVRPVRVLLPQYQPGPGGQDDGAKPSVRTAGHRRPALPRLRVVSRHPTALCQGAAGRPCRRHRAQPAAGGAARNAPVGGGALAAGKWAAGNPRHDLGWNAGRRRDGAGRQPCHGGRLMPSLSKVLQPIAPTCPAETPAADALQQLTSWGGDALLVVKNGAFVGLFGHREALAAFADGSGTVESYMRRPLPGRNIADSLESGADIMYREDTPVVLMTADEGPLFKKTSRTVGIVSAFQVLDEIGKTTTDTASNKVFVGRRDLGLNVPVSPCQRACPIHQDIAAYVDYVSQGRYLDSWLVIHETNPFPSMLGPLCNHPCETDCKRGWVQGPENAVSIKSLKRFATDYAWARRVKIDWQRAPGNGKRVAVVGAGPAGMTAAQDLRLMGDPVDLYEREAKLGGLLSASIPHFRFDLDQLNSEIPIIVDMGVNVLLNKNVGKDPKLEQLLSDYDAVFLSVGMMTGRILPVPGSDLP